MSGRTVPLVAFPNARIQSIFTVILAVLIAVTTTASPGRAAEGFRHQGLDGDAQRFETWLKANFNAAPKSFTEHLTNGRRLFKAGKDLRGAARAFSQAVVAKPDQHSAWQGLAEALIALPQNQLSGSERYRLPVNASAAAYRAYQQASGGEARARTLVVLSQALQRRSYWRPAIDAMRQALQIREDETVRKALTQLVAVHGFRITNYRVENETEAPRLCISFSEPIKGGDVSDFVAVDGKPAERVNVAGNQLCLSGFAHGKSYEVLVRSGLASREAEALQKNAELQIYVRDRSPSVRFTGRRYVLPSKGQRGLPVVTVNAESVVVEIFRVGDRGLAQAVLKGDLSRQLHRWSLEELRTKKGQQVYKGQLKVRSRLNEEVTSAIPVGEALEVLEAGVYAAVAWTDEHALENGHELATQWFIVSDLGLTAYKGRDGLHAFVRSLASAAPTEGARVSLVARNNEVLGETVTTAGGYARFEAGLVKGEGGLEPAVMVVRGKDGDYAFLDLSSGAFDLSDRGVAGRAAPGPVDGFLYLDRGVYRPGEVVQVAALVRDANGRAETVPVTLIVRRPDGVEHRRIVMRDGQLGGYTHALALDGGAMTGTWRLQLHVDPAEAAIAQTAFQVEDFVPERLAIDLTAERAFVAPGTPGTVAVSGRYLYGPPAADLAIEGDVIVRPDLNGLATYPGYLFGLQDRQITPAREALGDAGRTGEDGTAKVTVRLPAIEQTARPLLAEVQLRLKEPGGRVIERSVSMPVRTGTQRIGIKPLFKGALGEGEPARFEVITIDEDDRRTAMAGLRWEMVRLNRSWQWYKRDGAWQYEAITIPERVGEGTFDAGAAVPFRIEQDVTWGRYRIDVSRADGALIASSVYFNSGWHQTDDVDSPEMLAVALDKARYGYGETAKLKIQSRTPGKAMIAIFANGLVSARDVTLSAGDSTFDIPVDAAWGTGAYIVTTLYRSLDEATRRMPGRAIGVAWLGLDQGSRTLDVKLSAPEKIRSGTKLTVPVAVDGVGENGTARVTVAAVDVGVLNLTRFQSPAPSKWFYAQPVLDAEIRDLYGRLIDGMSAERGRLVSGGDADTSLDLQGSPPVEETVALFSGIVPVENGQATVTFDMPDINGAVRLMAVAWSGDKVGEASQSVVVRDPVAVTTTVPRFLTLGDEASLQISLHNVELEDAALTVTVARTYDGGKPEAIAERSLSLAKGAHGAERVVVKPERLGRVTYDVFVAGPDGLDIGRDFVFDVKAPAMDVRRHIRRELKPGQSYTLPADLVKGLVPGDARVSLAAGPGAELNVPALLAQLNRYPYGCAEQTISRALPLLYANDLSVDRGLTVDTALRGRIGQAIERVFQMQDSSGGFGAWGPNSADIWLSAYVTDFLTRAKEAGYTVDPRGFSQALARLQNYVAYVSDFKRGGEKRAYALYVLARSGKAPVGELRYYADTRLDRFATPLAKAQIGAALAMAGDRERAERAIGAAFDDLGDVGEQSLRHDYGSGLRDAAGVVALASEAKLLAGRVGALASRIGSAFAERRRTSTQEQAWLLLAARALTERAEEVQLSVGGAAYKGAVRLPIEPARLALGGDDGAGLVLTNTGSQATPMFLTVVGSAMTPEPAHESGFQIERAYYSLDGEAVDLQKAGATLTQSDRLVVVLTIESKDPAGRVLLVDRLPAGLEIENPRLVEGGDIKSLSWFKPRLRPNHTEFRDDRFVASFDFLSAGEKVRSASVAYIVRAVTPGRFVHPAAMVEDMYRPELYARTGGGVLEIKAD